MPIPRGIHFRSARQMLRFWISCAVVSGLALGKATKSHAAENGRPSPSERADAPATSAAKEIPLARPPNAEGGPLSLEAAIDRALQCSPQIMSLRAGVEVARQRKSAASDIPDPEGIMTWGKVENDFEDLGDTSANDKFRVGGRFFVPNPFLMAPKVNGGTANVRAATALLGAAKWQVECSVRRLYAEIHYLDEDVALTTKLAHQYDLILQDERSREGQGATTASEIVTAVHRELEAQNDLEQVRDSQQAARRELAGMLNLDLTSTPLELATNISDFRLRGDAAGSEGELERIAFQNRNDLAVLHWQTLAARSAYVEARNVRVPWVKHVEFTRRDSAAEWWLGVGISVPLFSWTINNTDGVQQAELKLAQANEFNGALMMRREIRDAMDEYQTQQRRQERNQDLLAPLLSEMQKTLDVLRRTPNVMPSQVATTEAQITESLRLKLESEWLYQLAGLNLERAAGIRLSDWPNGE